MIKTKRLIINDLILEDVEQIFNWKRNSALLMLEYDFINSSDTDTNYWYRERISQPRLKSYTVKNSEGRVIGFISIRNIRRFFKSAILGVTFDERYIGKGYGTEALIGFLDYYFNTLNMRTMKLDVGMYNFRALKCYKNLGFEIKKKTNFLVPRRFGRFKHELIKNPDQYNNNTFFILQDNLVLIYYRMSLTKTKFNKLFTNCG
ncbi:MAG: GNAT family protein [Andreesenia angusta]|nr:GNAT family protein [Andreesenia angusta]